MNLHKFAIKPFGASVRTALLLPFIIFFIAVKFDRFFPSYFEEQIAYLMLKSWRNDTRTVAKLKIIGTAITGNEAITHKRFNLGCQMIFIITLLYDTRWKGELSCTSQMM